MPEGRMKRRSPIVLQGGGLECAWREKYLLLQMPVHELVKGWKKSERSMNLFSSEV